MAKIRLVLVLLIVQFLIFIPSAAAEPLLVDLPTTGIPALDEAIRFIGAAYILLSILAAVLPSSWRATQLLRQFVADLRALLTKPGAPPSAEEPKQ